METIGSLSTNLWVLEIIALAAAAVWAIIKGTDLYARIRDGRAGKALIILDAAVHDTWTTYTKAIKDAAADGKLTDEEAASARACALSKAKEIAAAQGINLAKEFGADMLNYLLESAVQSLQKDGVIGKSAGAR